MSPQVSVQATWLQSSAPASSLLSPASTSPPVHGPQWPRYHSQGHGKWALRAGSALPGDPRELDGCRAPVHTQHRGTAATS